MEYNRRPISIEAGDSEAGKENLGHESDAKAIRQLEKPMQIILRDLRDKIDAGLYKLVLGEDVSGRIPTLLFNEVLRSLYKEKGFENPKVNFYAPDLRLSEAETKEKLNNISATIKPVLNSTFEKEGAFISIINEIFKRDQSDKERVLVVTEAIGFGRSLSFVTHVLKEMKVPFDIASIAMDNPESLSVKELEKTLGGKIYHGHVIGMPSVYRRKGIAGVEKRGAKATSYKLTDSGVQEKVNLAREEVRKVSDDLVKWYKSNK